MLFQRRRMDHSYHSIHHPRPSIIVIRKFIIIIIIMISTTMMNINGAFLSRCDGWIMTTISTTATRFITQRHVSSSLHRPLHHHFSPSSSSSSSLIRNHRTFVPQYRRDVIRQSLSSLSSSSSSSSGSGSGGGGRISNAVRDENLLQKTSSDPNSKKHIVEPLSTTPVKGTRDFYPEDMKLRNWLFTQWKDVAKLYGFVEYDAPILESELLYTRKAGEEVVQQLYNFVDKGERAVSLRPEMTPSLARMVMAKKNTISFPMKWFSIPQCWRYERMTRGRRREHYQWNMDIWGIHNVQAEVELMSAMIYFFKKVGLTSADVGIKMNSRLVINEVLTKFGITDESLFAPICVLIDKLEKVPIDAIQEELLQYQLEKEIVEQLLHVLSNKSIDTLKETLGESSVAIQQLTKLIQLCHDYQIEDWIQFDASVVRGLSYYTGIVFEAFDKKGQLRAIAGGGRYDQLLSNTFQLPETEAIPAVGYGFGDAVIIELLKERNLLPSLNQYEDNTIDFMIYAMSHEYYSIGLQVANRLRYEFHKRVDMILDGEQRKTKWVFKQADRMNANYCIIIGTTEYENQMISIKNLKNGNQTSIPIDQLADWVKDI
jgi:histidyl-tRNA synthetase